MRDSKKAAYFAKGEQRSDATTIRGVSSRLTTKGLALHSVRASQYCVHDYQKLMEQFGIIASISRKGNCRDTHRWQVFGALKMSLCITGATAPELRRYGRLPPTRFPS
jgi:putative transposase